MKLIKDTKGIHIHDKKGVGFRYWQSDLQLMFTEKDTQNNFNVLYLDEKLILNTNINMNA